MARKKVKSGEVADAVKMRRLSCSIDAAVYSRAGAYAHWRGESLGALVSRALDAELSKVRFTVYCHTARPSPALPEGPESPSDASAGDETRRTG